MESLVEDNENEERKKGKRSISEELRAYDK